MLKQAVRCLSVILLAFSACSSSGGASTADAANVSAPICVEPTSTTLADAPATGGAAACLDVGLRAGGGCLAELLAGLCVPNVSRSEIATFVRTASNDYQVFMRSQVTMASAGTIASDERTISGIENNQPFTIQSALSGGARIQLSARFTGDQISITSLDHEDPF